MIRVLFVCLGNICRSPMAEAIFKDLVKREQLSDKIGTDSAGTGHWHVGESPHEGTRNLLDKQRISYEGIKARQFDARDFQDFNYLIAMDDENISSIRGISDKHDDIMVAKLMDFVDEAEEASVPDPYLTGNFDYTYELVSKGCSALLNYIRKENNI
ncbi:low molecular weight protein-tyrosine-phosphatase [Lentibacillus amyloliquefaciens]|uniref:protein-tyrosine-phosphatase n=1 Tax=Lentibacillus amyloliquefaciens TaxID=1472767 RepID=A0A0U3W722_9BACI|nr:low molecular weight protein-tyrosine-phosphatase [Lentibacillus amyloliquefaciens]ALX48976.1 hypothetical protein AOX59_10430 [Lentibacillus amyloliquefaciens]